MTEYGVFLIRLSRDTHFKILSLEDHIHHQDLTLDEHCRDVTCDVLGDSQGVPGVNGPIGKNYSAWADVIAAVVLIGLSHGCYQLLGTDVEEVSTLFHMIPVWETRAYQCNALWNWKPREATAGVRLGNNSGRREKNWIMIRQGGNV